MKIIEVVVPCQSRTDRVEIFPFFDMHIGKANCNETAIQKQVQEILHRKKIKNRHVYALLGGDVLNSISPADRKRFDFSDIADWLTKGTPEEIKDAISDLPYREIKRAYELLRPIKNSIVGALEGNHEKSLRKFHNFDVQSRLCEKLDCPNLSDEALIRFRFKRLSHTSTIIIYMRHGYGGGRAAGAEPAKLYNMLAEWECADVCLTGHTHTYCNLPPKPVGRLPRKGLLAEGLVWDHRFALNPGCWLDSHALGRGSYESQACYPARAHMTAKIVVWPFFEQYINGRTYASPKIEIRSYPIL